MKFVTINCSDKKPLDCLFKRIQDFECAHQGKIKENRQWLFRGKHTRFQLSSGLERACDNANIEPKNRFKVEGDMMREFRRWYDGEDKNDVREDDLYCLSVMQHFGAPTRLIDWTYSKYVALYFALESAKDDMKEGGKGKTSCTVWCLDAAWLNKENYERAPQIGIPKDLLDKMNIDEERKTAISEIFNFGEQDVRHRELVIQVNSLYFHSRLYAQQAVFLCPCDLNQSFETNLNSMQNASSSAYKIVCELDLCDVLEGLERLWRMNISRMTLFPGLEGFTKSLAYRLKFMEKLYNWRH